MQPADDCQRSRPGCPGRGTSPSHSETAAPAVAERGRRDEARDVRTPTLLASAMLVACAPSGGSWPARRAPAPERSSTALHEVELPPPFAPAARAAHRAEVLALEGGAWPAGPTFETPGRLLADPDPARLVSVEEFDRRALSGQPEAGVGPGEIATVNPRFFRREPKALLRRDGTLDVFFEVTRPCPGASVYYGVAVPTDPFATARYRRRAGGMTVEGGVHHVRFDIRPLLRARYDVTTARVEGQGVFRWRLEALDPERGTTRVYDGRTAYACEPGEDGAVGCSATSPLRQLPTVRLGPFIDLLDHDSVTVSFETDVPTRGLVALTTGDGDAIVGTVSEPRLRHEIPIEGLEADTRYRYAVFVAGARGDASEGRSATFRTWPAPEDDHRVRFAVLSDSRSGHGAADAQYAGTNRAVLEDLLDIAFREGARFAAFVGDLVDGYTTHRGSFEYELEAWQRATERVGALMPIYEGFGNHEALIEYRTPGWAIARSGAVSAEQIFAWRFVNPPNGPAPAERGDPPYRENVFSVGAGPAHLAFVNSNYFWRSHAEREDHPGHGRGYREGWVDDRQLAWLERDLAGAREAGRRHLFVLTHEPAFPNGGHTRDGMWWQGRFADVLAMRRRFLSVLSAAEVRALLHGDEHNYSRTRVHAGLDGAVEHPFFQLISGGAGAPYYARDRDVPWADDVRAFDARQHLILIDVEGDAATAQVLGRSGELIEEVDLTAVE
jgi:hypothetical protein